MPDFTIEDTERFWDELSKDYDEINKKAHSYQRRFVDGFRMIKLKQGGKVLDIGSGTGNCILYMSKLGKFDMTGIEVSGGMMERAKEKLKRAGVKAKLIKGNAEKIPFPDNRFDNVLCYEILEHTPHPERMVSEIARVLKKGGTTLITTPNPLWEPLEKLAAITGLHHSEGPSKITVSRKIRKFIREAGMELVQEKKTVLVPIGPKFLVRIGEALEKTPLVNLGLRRMFLCRKL